MADRAVADKAVVAEGAAPVKGVGFTQEQLDAAKSLKGKYSVVSRMRRECVDRTTVNGAAIDPAVVLHTQGVIAAYDSIHGVRGSKLLTRQMKALDATVRAEGHATRAHVDQRLTDYFGAPPAVAPDGVGETAVDTERQIQALRLRSMAQKAEERKEKEILRLEALAKRRQEKADLAAAAAAAKQHAQEVRRLEREAKKNAKKPRTE